MIDLLISNGYVVDGTGSPGFYGHVAVEGDTLSIIRGDVSELPAGRVIDATSQVICPGFIDLHCHTGLTILGSPYHEPKVRQGVTTELVGIDGISHAPFKTPEELERYIWMDAGLNGYPPQADWLTVADLLSKYDRTVAVNIAYILGNSPVRIWSVGWSDAPASAAEIADMASVVREAMEEGAYGLSTGLDYPPGSFASTDELVALSRASARLGGMYHTHTRGSLRAQSPLAPYEEALEIGQRSDSPVHLTHYASGASADVGGHAYLGLLEDARKNGLDVTFDCYTYSGATSTSATITIPQWAKAAGPEGLMSALQNADERVRIKRAIDDAAPYAGSALRWTRTSLTNFTLPENLQYEGKTVAAIAEMRGGDPTEVFMDLLVEERLGLSNVGAGVSEELLPAFVSHPAGALGSDGILLGEFPSPRSYGTFPRALGHFVRTGKYATLEEMVRKMTSFPAQRLGLPDRGLLRDGFRADIVIFDPATVGSAATRENPKVYPTGIDYVIVNGTVVIDGGNHTGALPGRALRRGRPRT